jgi:hypothetical protein
MDNISVMLFLHAINSVIALFAIYTASKAHKEEISQIRRVHRLAVREIHSYYKQEKSPKELQLR